ncbi:MAG: hypothetical protein V3V32_04360 [Dehalococcoidia bacterium]
MAKTINQEVKEVVEIGNTYRVLIEGCPKLSGWRGPSWHIYIEQLNVPVHARIIYKRGAYFREGNAQRIAERILSALCIPGIMILGITEYTRDELAEYLLGAT